MTLLLLQNPSADRIDFQCALYPLALTSDLSFYITYGRQAVYAVGQQQHYNRANLVDGLVRPDFD